MFPMGIIIAQRDTIWPGGDVPYILTADKITSVGEDLLRV